jgi:hypothetical protein
MIRVLIVLILALSACSQKQPSGLQPNVPGDWYQAPEDRGAEQKRDGAPEEGASEAHLKSLEGSVDHILNANSEALEEAQLASQAVPPGMPADWVPWHAEIFTTDLTLSAKGLIGALLTKGQATVRAYWRKQGPAPIAAMESLDAPANEPSITIQEETSVQGIMEQIDPLIRASAAAGKIKDTPELRQQLLGTAMEFQSVAKAISETGTDDPWWVSRYRLDLTVDASGSVAPAVKVGGEVRFRFEWHRIKKHQHVAHGMLASAQQQLLNRNLENFVRAISQDLEASFGDLKKKGFQAHTMRMGIGVSAKGNIGVVKGNAGLVGQIYFTHSCSRPVVRRIEAVSHEPLYIIERDPSEQHLKYAASHAIPYHIQGGVEKAIDEVVYKVDRANFRKGLKKAASIAEFFADRAARAKSGNWKIYELRTAFDSSVSGDLELVTIGGNVTAQVAFFNQNF